MQNTHGNEINTCTCPLSIHNKGFSYKQDCFFSWVTSNIYHNIAFITDHNGPQMYVCQKMTDNNKVQTSTWQFIIQLQSFVI